MKFFRPIGKYVLCRLVVDNTGKLIQDVNNKTADSIIIEVLSMGNKVSKSIVEGHKYCIPGHKTRVDAGSVILVEEDDIMCEYCQEPDIELAPKEEHVGPDVDRVITPQEKLLGFLKQC